MSGIKPQCSIVIRCFNEEEHIVRLLSGIMEQTIKSREIIIVDSGSTDATVSIASRYPVTILNIDAKDFSFGRSLNIGCEKAQSDMIVIASAHVYPVFNNWLEKLLCPFDDSHIALTYGKQIGNEVTKYSENQVFKKWFPKNSHLNQNTPFCNNANAAIRRSVWLQFPYNNELTGLEDLDWAKRTMAAGHSVAYIPEAVIVHVHNESYKSIYNRYRREAIAKKRIFPDDHFNLWDFIQLFTANIISDYCHALRDHVFRQNIVGIFSFRFMQFWGTYRGFHQHGTITSELNWRFYYPNGLKQEVSNEAECGAKHRINYSSIVIEGEN